MDNVLLLTKTTAQGYHDYNYIIAEENLEGDDSAMSDSRAGKTGRAAVGKFAPSRRRWRPGAMERPPVFADNDRPGVMLAGAGADLY